MPFGDLKVVLLKVNAITDLRPLHLLLSTPGNNLPRYPHGLLFRKLLRRHLQEAPQSTTGISYPYYYVPSWATLYPVMLCICLLAVSSNQNAGYFIAYVL